MTEQTEEQPREPYQSVKSKSLTAAVLSFLSVTYNLYYNIHYENTHRLNEVKDKGFILMPNHQSNNDIPLEGLLLRDFIGRQAYYIMKDSLPFLGLLKKLGGVSITRMKDIDKLTDKATDPDYLKSLRKEAITRKKEVYNIIGDLIFQDEIVVFHPQGTRGYKEPFEPDKSKLKELLRKQKELGQQIPFVPLTISYENRWKPRSHIIIDVGNPILVPDRGIDQLANRLLEEIQPYSIR